MAQELAYHEKLYSGFAQEHFAKPAVRALREHLVQRILQATGASPRARILSAGCGIGDTELLLAPRVGEVVGVDISPAAIAQARADAERAGVSNFSGHCGTLESLAPALGKFDAVIGIFFLHHLDEESLAALPAMVQRLLRPGGVLYTLDPSAERLSGRVGEWLCPRLMARYQSPNERQLSPARTAALFQAKHGYYDFVSTPLAGLLPTWHAGYRVARAVDELLIRTPGVRRLSSNFEVIATASPARAKAPQASSSRQPASRAAR